MLCLCNTLINIYTQHSNNTICSDCFLFYKYILLVVVFLRLPYIAIYLN